MSGKDRIAIFPSRGAMTTMKGRLKGAQKGHSLLKRKADALQLRFRMILKKIVDTKQTMGEVMKEAAFSLAEAKFASGDFSQVGNFKFIITRAVTHKTIIIWVEMPCHVCNRTF